MCLRDRQSDSRAEREQDERADKKRDKFFHENSSVE
jgi:hypothetical protein